MPSVITRTVRKALFQNKENKKKEKLQKLERKVNIKNKWEKKNTASKSGIER